MKDRTHFAFPHRLWADDGEDVVEHLAGVENFTLALGAFKIACERWPKATLTLRPTGLASPAYEHLEDWTILEDGREVGRMYEDGSASTPPELKWFWSIVVYVQRGPAGMSPLVFAAIGGSREAG